jgi:TPR repeat protein
MVEGSSDKVPHNENKGLNWLKEAAKKGSQEAAEYKTYWDIRFDRAPNLQKITANLNKIIDNNKSCRACNTLAEINHAQGSSARTSEDADKREVGEQKAALAAKYYMMSAE